jgi:hypothetical protein
MNLLNTILNPTIPYTVGSKSSSGGIPVNVNLNLDKDFKNTIYKTAGIISLGIAFGIFAGVVYSKTKGK